MIFDKTNYKLKPLNNMKKKLLLGVALLGMSTLVSATNYYAAPGAKGDGKSISNPGDLNNLASKTIAGGDSLRLSRLRR